MRGITIRRFLRVKTCVQHENHVKTVSKCMPEEKSVCRRPQAMRRIKNYLFFCRFLPLWTPFPVGYAQVTFPKFEKSLNPPGADPTENGVQSEKNRMRRATGSS